MKHKMVKILEEKIYIREEDLDVEPTRICVILACYNPDIISKKYAVRARGMFQIFDSETISKGIKVCES